MRAPDRLYIDQNDRDLYKRIEQERLFAEQPRREQFLLAMAVGLKNDFLVPLEKRDGFFLAKDLREDDEILIDAVAVHKCGPGVLENKQEVYRIAEEYARGGIRLIVDAIQGTALGTYEKAFELEVFNMYRDLCCEGDSVEESPVGRARLSHTHEESEPS